MRLHIEKEERCLFFVADAVLAKMPDDRLLPRALAIDKENSDRLARAQEEFWRLAERLAHDRVDPSR
jgi:hypothetical protein